MLRTLVDLDDVVIDFVNPLLARVNKKYGTSFERTDIDRWHATLGDESKPVELDQEIAIAVKSTQWIAQLPLVAGADLVHELTTFGLKPFFGTDRPLELFPVTRKWLDRKGFLYPLLPKATYYFFNDAIDLVIDDKGEFIKTCKGSKRILLTQPWNANIDVSGDPDIHRVSNWYELIDLLKSGWYAKA
jgi:hypothetical protein